MAAILPGKQERYALSSCIGKQNLHFIDILKAITQAPETEQPLSRGPQGLHQLSNFFISIPQNHTNFFFRIILPRLLNAPLVILSMY